MGGIKSKDISITATETPDHKLNCKCRVTFPKWKQFAYHPQYRLELLHSVSCITSVHHWKHRNISWEDVKLPTTFWQSLSWKKLKAFLFRVDILSLWSGPEFLGRRGGRNFALLLPLDQSLVMVTATSWPMLSLLLESCDSFPPFSLPPQR